MFDEGERTIHKDIEPAKYRLTDYKRKSINKIFIDQHKDRPISGVTSNNNLAEVATQATFEEDEKSTINLPFKVFYTTGEPVVFTTINRFEGKSNYMNYYPTTELIE